MQAGVALPEVVFRAALVLVRVVFWDSRLVATFCLFSSPVKQEDILSWNVDPPSYLALSNPRIGGGRYVRYRRFADGAPRTRRNEPQSLPSATTTTLSTPAPDFPYHNAHPLYLYTACLAASTSSGDPSPPPKSTLLDFSRLLFAQTASRVLRSRATPSLPAAQRSKCVPPARLWLVARSLARGSQDTRTECVSPRFHRCLQL